MSKVSRVISHLGEFGLIDLIRKLMGPDDKVVKGIGDDTAVLPLTKDKYLLFTTDMIAEDVHFSRGMNPRAVGHKALGCSISDIAAMGGWPTYAVVSLAVPAQVNVQFIKEIYQGMTHLAKKYEVQIVGGDTIKARQIVINVALLGEVRKEHLVTRDGAQAGDSIYVTGSLGRSLETLRHLKFTPRVFEAQQLVRYAKPSAMIDISDGLVGDLGHILKASQAGAILFEERIPRRSGATIPEALYDGEDFELLLTLSPKKAKRLSRFSELKIPLHLIGGITDQKEKLIFMDKRGRSRLIDARGYDHFNEFLPIPVTAASAND